MGLILLLLWPLFVAALVLKFSCKRYGLFSKEHFIEEVNDFAASSIAWFYTFLIWLMWSCPAFYAIYMFL